MSVSLITQMFRDFARIFWNFARIFDESIFGSANTTDHDARVATLFKSRSVQNGK